VSFSPCGCDRSDRWADEEAVTLYAEPQPTYGGAYRKGSRLVVMFTDDLDEHEAAIRQLVSIRRHVLIRHANRTWAEVQRANEWVAERVTQREDTNVISVGVGLEGDQFVIFVEPMPPT
jgi:hypothetical protein